MIHPHIEQVLRQIILKDLANKGRLRWDKPHTEAVVYWTKQLLKKINSSSLNPKILITAAYAHDWGYVNLFKQKKPITTDQIRLQKDLHMKKSAEMIERLIYQRLSSYFSEGEILRLIHLVSIHDYVDQLKDEDELFSMECDTIGMLDVDRVLPTFSAKENEYFMEHSIYNLRLPKFMHPEAKKIAEKLIEKRQQFYKSLEK